jgi:type I restriction enzyme S subunit
MHQEPTDEPATEWLRRSSDCAIDQSGHDRPKTTASVPNNWIHVTLDEIAPTVTSGSRGWAQYYVPDGALFIRSQNVKYGYLRMTDRVFVRPPPLAEGSRTAVNLGDLLIVITGDVGHVGIWDRDLGEAYVSQHVALVKPISRDISRWLLLALMAPAAGRNQLRASIYGGKPGLNLTQVRSITLPLPPLAEQHRIVAKVDELMALCDQLEGAQKERELQRDALRSVSLRRLSEPEDGPCDVWFFLDHSPRLITKPEHVAAVRQTILDLAVRGRLVAQKPGDIAASGAGTHPEQVPFVIPMSWLWKPVTQLGTARLGKMLDRAKNRGTPRRYLRNLNVRWFDFDLSDVKYMPFENAELEEFSLLPGDVLICEGGEPGRAAVWDGREPDVYFQKALHRVRVSDEMNPYYLVLFLRASAHAGRLVAQSTGATFRHLTGQALASVMVSTPPLAEQLRIVAKVNELMAVCDELEAALASAQDGRGQLLESLLHEPLDGVGVPTLVGAGQ